MFEIRSKVIVRTYSAGVFAGTLARKDGKEVELTNARRLWYWRGAASLSQLATVGFFALYILLHCDSIR